MSRELRQFSKSQLIDVARTMTEQRVAAQAAVRRAEAGVRRLVALAAFGGVGIGVVIGWFL